MKTYTITDIISLLNLSDPPSDKASYYISCPKCDQGRHKHLNINVVKNAYRCPRCGEKGGIFDLYSLFTGVRRDNVKRELDRIFSGENSSLQASRKAETDVLSAVCESTLADIAIRDTVYRMLLERLALAPNHMESLLARGLSECIISERKYRSSLVVGGAVLAKQLTDNGCPLDGIPGFYQDDSGRWKFVECKKGILIPVRDVQGRIQGLQIRLDNETKRKFRWISSTGRQCGCKAEGWVHVAGLPRARMLLTEGPMKADVIHHLTGQSVIAVPGVNALSQLESTLVSIHELGVQHIMTCFDMDFLSNFNVQNGYRELTALISRQGISYGTYLWPPEYKGLDDYIWEYCLQQNKV